MIHTIDLPDDFFDDKPECVSNAEYLELMKHAYTYLDNDMHARRGLTLGLIQELQHARAEALKNRGDRYGGSE